MPARDRKEPTVEGPIQPRLDQAPLRHKEGSHPLNVVLIVTTTRRPHVQAHVVLFSRDLTLAYASRVDY